MSGPTPPASKARSCSTSPSRRLQERGQHILGLVELRRVAGSSQTFDDTWVTIPGRFLQRCPALAVLGGNVHTVIQE